jgi:hypothetical protein
MTYLKKGLLVDAAIVAVFLVWSLLATILTYNGTCSNPGFMGGPSHRCTFFEALSDEIFGFLLIGVIYLWWLIIPTLMLPPVIGLFIELWSNSKANR